MEQTPKQTRARKTTPAEWLEMVASKAEELRRHGVSRVEMDGCIVEFAPANEPIVFESRDTEEHRDPLDDPETFGGRLPSLLRSNG